MSYNTFDLDHNYLNEYAYLYTLEVNVYNILVTSIIKTDEMQRMKKYACI